MIRIGNIANCLLSNSRKMNWYLRNFLMALLVLRLDRIHQSLVNRAHGKKANDAKVPLYTQIKRHMLIYLAKHLAPIQHTTRNHNERAVAQTKATAQIIFISYLLFRVQITHDQN